MSTINDIVDTAYDLSREIRDMEATLLERRNHLEYLRKQVQRRMVDAKMEIAAGHRGVAVLCVGHGKPIVVLADKH